MPQDTQTGESPRQAEVGGEIRSAIEQESVITIQAPAIEIYHFWRNLKNLPAFMKHLSSVEILTNTRSHWKWKALLNQIDVEWESEITADIPGSKIAWHSVENSTVQHQGEVTFTELPFGRGTEVRVSLRYHPPGGVVTDLIEKMLGESPAKTLRADLYRLRELIEVGVIATIDGQSKGGVEATINPVLYTHH